MQRKGLAAAAATTTTLVLPPSPPTKVISRGVKACLAHVGLVPPDLNEHVGIRAGTPAGRGGRGVYPYMRPEGIFVKGLSVYFKVFLSFLRLRLGA